MHGRMVCAHVLRYHLDLDEFIKPEKEWKTYKKERLLANQVDIGVLGLGIGSATATNLRNLILT